MESEVPFVQYCHGTMVAARTKEVSVEPTPPTSVNAQELTTDRYFVPKTNKLAVTSMVLGILWLWWLGSVVAIVLGHISLTQIRQSNGAQDGRGMAIVGLVLGYLGLATFVISLLLAFAYSPL